jgi:polyphosphate kinase 2 (PPK2 family)
MVDQRAKLVAKFIKPLRVKPGSTVKLARDFDPGYKASFLKKKDGAGVLEAGVGVLADYQAQLAAQDTWGVLVCLQALDAGGKDGTIRHVMSGVNPQGVHVSGFKVPSAQELNHDYLWRYAQRLPGRGEIGIFNRSHYEEVLVVRVHPELLDRKKLPAAAKGKGVGPPTPGINDWEHFLSDNGFKVVKSFLNLSGRSSGYGSSSGSTCRKSGSSRRATRGASTGTTTRPRSRRCCRTPPPNGRRGM